MLTRIKKALYFPFAYYFRVFASIQLSIWKPKVILITGSSGKTTLLNLLESQLGSSARYSHHANSAYGISFDILGLHRTKLTKDEWISIILLAPLRAFKKPYAEKVYVVEADCDRPHEGKFLGSMLNPSVTLWLNVSKTHSVNFDYLVEQGKFSDISEAIAYEFGYYAEYASELVIVNGDSELIEKQLSRVKANITKIHKKSELRKYQVFEDGTRFNITNDEYVFKYLLPEDTLYALVMVKTLLQYINKELDITYKHFKMPPGRSSVFKGIKRTTIIDSSYNSNLSSAGVILDMYQKLDVNKKWLILGDMVELGNEESEEHRKLAKIIANMKLDKIILMGPRVSSFTYPLLVSEIGNGSHIEKFLSPSEVLDYLLNNLKGGETMLFKGARFLEGVIEHLLLNKEDIVNLSRREKIWEVRRRKWGL